MPDDPNPANEIVGADWRPPGRLHLEAAPAVFIDAISEAGAQRLGDWITARDG
jgi:hypothetical protein